MSRGLIILILEVTFGIAAMILANLVYKDTELGAFLFGLSMALSLSVGGQLAFITYQKTRKLTDKDRVKKVGAIERKAEQRALARAKAGYLTLQVAGYLLSLSVMTLFFSQMGGVVMEVLFYVLLAGAVVFAFLYIVFMSKKED